MAEPGMIPFSVENDFEGEWVGDEFYGRKKERKNRGGGKEQAIYGIWAEEDDGGGARGGLGSGGRGGGSALGMNFVASHVIGGSDDADASDKKNDKAQSNGGEGTSRPPKEKRKRQKRAKLEDAVPTSFGGRPRNSFAGEARAGIGMGGGIGSGGGAGSSVQPQWEKHTKGFGSKMLQKYGWRGDGLGSKGQGIAKPLETKQRPQRMGLAFGNFKERTVPAPDEMDVSSSGSDESGDEARATKKRAPAWKNTGKKRVKVKYEMPELGRAAVDSALATKDMIIDMRGAEARVLTDLKDAAGVPASGASVHPQKCPELVHNVRTLVDLALVDVQNLDRKILWQDNNIAAMKKEKARIEKQLDEEDAALERVEQINSIIQKVKERLEATDNPITLDALARVFALLQTKYEPEYRQYHLGSLAYHLVAPKLRAVLALWKPLAEPSKHTEIMAAWRNLLVSDDGGGEYAHVYDSLCEQCVLPRMRSELTYVQCNSMPPHACTELLTKLHRNGWNVINPEPAVALLEGWKDVMPESMYQTMLSQIIIPRLTAMVDQWNPRTDLPPHTWIHPWLPLLQRRLQVMYPTLRMKFVKALVHWHPQDASALHMLKPWHKVFQSSNWNALIFKSVLPKLAAALHQLVVNPASQTTAPLEWVLRWEGVIPSEQLAAIFVREFFPKWHAALNAWLASSPDFHELAMWYKGWKGMLPAFLVRQDVIREELNRALRAISDCLDKVS